MESFVLGNQILEKHIGITRPSFYAGRGPCPSDLDSWKLLGIFIDLYEIDRNYGENFIRLVDSIPSIGATEFINAYNNFARNGFVFESGETIGDKFTIEGKTDIEQRQSAAINVLAASGIFSVNRPQAEAARVSRSIKDYFYELTRDYYLEKFGIDMFDADETVISDDVHKIIDPLYRGTFELDEWYDTSLKRYFHKY